MIDLIRNQDFESLQKELASAPLTIHKILLKILKEEPIEDSDYGFKVDSLQKEFFEGQKLFLALQESELEKAKSQAFLQSLVVLSFKIGTHIQGLYQRALAQGLSISELDGSWKIDPNLRPKMQDLYELLLRLGGKKAAANMAAAKAKITVSMPETVGKEAIGKDMLQFGNAYAAIGMEEQAVQIYRGILRDFECESVRNSSGLLPEIQHVDTREAFEIRIFEEAAKKYEALSGLTLPKVNRVRGKGQTAGEKPADPSGKTPAEGDEKAGLWGKLKGMFGGE